MIRSPFAATRRTRSGRWKTCWICCVFLCAISGFHVQSSCAADVVDPAELRKAEAAATEAKVFFKAGLFDKASDKFMEAFAISKRPSLMFNAARAYEENGNLPQAVALLKHYRDLPDVGADGRQEADTRIARMEAILRDQAAAQEAKRLADQQLEAQKAEELRQKLERDRLEKDRLERERLTNLPQEVTPLVADKRGPVLENRQIPWALTATAAGLLVVAGVTYSVALYEQYAANHVPVTSDNFVDLSLGHANDAVILRGIAVGAAVGAAGVAAWAVWDWVHSGNSAAQNSSHVGRLDVFPAPGGGMLAWRAAF